MPEPSYRRRFVSRQEDKFRIQSPDEHQGIIDPEPGILYTPPVVATEKEADGSTAASLKLPTVEPVAVTRDAPPVRLPSNAHTLRTWQALPGARPVFTARATALLVLLGLALGGIGGAAWPRMRARPAAPGARARPPENATALTPEEADALDTAYAARHDGNFALATQLFTGLAFRHPQWETMPIEVGRTLLYQKKLDEAHHALATAAGRGTAPADAYFLMGALALIRRAYADAENHLATAVALDPTRAEFYYLWGDCLRKEGKPGDAAAKFRSALLRNQYETAAGLYRLKLWLSEIESDREKTDGTGAEIDAALARAHPPMEALFAAAARALLAGDVAGAANDLTRARAGVDADVFVVIMRDPIFAQERARPELAEFYPPAAPMAGPPPAAPAAVESDAGAVDGTRP